MAQERRARLRDAFVLVGVGGACVGLLIGLGWDAFKSPEPLTFAQDEAIMFEAGSTGCIIWPDVIPDSRIPQYLCANLIDRSAKPEFQLRNIELITTQEANEHVRKRGAQSPASQDPGQGKDSKGDPGGDDSSTSLEIVTGQDHGPQNEGNHKQAG